MDNRFYKPRPSRRPPTLPAQRRVHCPSQPRSTLLPPCRALRPLLAPLHASPRSARAGAARGACWRGALRRLQPTRPRRAPASSCARRRAAAAAARRRRAPAADHPAGRRDSRPARPRDRRRGQCRVPPRRRRDPRRPAELRAGRRPGQRARQRAHQPGRQRLQRPRAAAASAALRGLLPAARPTTSRRIGAGGHAERVDFLDDQRAVATGATYTSCRPDGTRRPGLAAVDRPRPARLRDQRRRRRGRACCASSACRSCRAGAQLPADRRAQVGLAAAEHRPRQQERLRGRGAVLLEHRAATATRPSRRRSSRGAASASTPSSAISSRATAARSRYNLLPERPRRRPLAPCARLPPRRARRQATSPTRRTCCASPTTTTGRTFRATIASLTPRLLPADLQASRAAPRQRRLDRLCAACSAGRCCRTPIRRRASRRPTSACRSSARAISRPARRRLRVRRRGRVQPLHPARPAILDPTRSTGSRLHALGSVSRPFVDAGLDLHAAAVVQRRRLRARPAARRRAHAAPSRVIPTLSLDSAWVLERDARWFGRAVRQTLEPRLLYVNTPFRDQTQLPNFDSAAQATSTSTRSTPRTPSPASTASRTRTS